MVIVQYQFSKHQAWINETFAACRLGVIEVATPDIYYIRIVFREIDGFETVSEVAIIDLVVAITAEPATIAILEKTATSEFYW